MRTVYLGNVKRCLGTKFDWNSSNGVTENGDFVWRVRESWGKNALGKGHHNPNQILWKRHPVGRYLCTFVYSRSMGDTPAPLRTTAPPPSQGVMDVRDILARCPRHIISINNMLLKNRTSLHHLKRLLFDSNPIVSVEYDNAGMRSPTYCADTELVPKWSRCHLVCVFVKYYLKALKHDGGTFGQTNNVHCNAPNYFIDGVIQARPPATEMVYPRAAP